jgi:hypothetical protein
MGEDMTQFPTPGQLGRFLQAATDGLLRDGDGAGSAVVPGHGSFSPENPMKLPSLTQSEVAAWGQCRLPVSSG